MFLDELIPILGILLVMIPITGLTLVVTVHLALKPFAKSIVEALESRSGARQVPADLERHLLNLQEQVDEVQRSVAALRDAREFDRRLEAGPARGAPVAEAPHEG